MRYSCDKITTVDVGKQKEFRTSRTSYISMPLLKNTIMQKEYFFFISYFCKGRGWGSWNVKA